MFRKIDAPNAYVLAQCIIVVHLTTKSSMTLRTRMPSVYLVIIYFTISEVPYVNGRSINLILGSRMWSVEWLCFRRQTTPIFAYFVAFHIFVVCKHRDFIFDVQVDRC